MAANTGETAREAGGFRCARGGQGSQLGAGESAARPSPPADLEARRLCLEARVGAPFSMGNSVRALHNGDAFFPAMLQAIREARRSINLVSYIYRKGRIAEEFCEALCERARAGVTVRILFDAIGSSGRDASQVASMREAGADVRLFRRPRKFPRKLDRRSHRKALICDNAVGYVGGMGIGRHWEGDASDPEHWREMQFELRGPSVYGLNASFWENWLEVSPESTPEFSAVAPVETSGQVAAQVVNVHSGRADQSAKALAQTLFWLARERIDIVTAYLAPDPELVAALRERVEAGVAVRLLVPGPCADVPVAQWYAERQYDELLQAGIRIFRYQPTMLHSKAIVIDDDLAMVGSLNLDQRSFYKDEEVAVTLQDRAFVAELDSALAEDFAASHEVRLEEWRRRPLGRKLLGLLASAFRSEV